MELTERWERVRAVMDRIDFARLWPGFAPCRFALYTDSECVLDGRRMDKPAEFCANTAMKYNGETIAMWNMMEEINDSVLAGKMAHEMFHAFQMDSGWDCFPNETEALLRYHADGADQEIRLRANRLLAELAGRSDIDKLNEVLRLRKWRQKEHPCEYGYEALEEQLEGSANYVEWKAREMIDPARAEKLRERMKRTMTNTDELFPVRVACYTSGALLIDAMARAGLDPFSAPVPFARSLLPGDVPDIRPERDDEAARALKAYDSETRRIVESAVAKNDVALTGSAEIKYFNIYDARHRDGYLTSTYFVMCIKDGQDVMLQGDFVIETKDGITADRILRA